MFKGSNLILMLIELGLNYISRLLANVLNLQPVSQKYFPIDLLRVTVMLLGGDEQYGYSEMQRSTCGRKVICWN